MQPDFTRGGELERVAEQVVDHLAQAARVAVPGIRNVRLHRQQQAVATGDG